MAIIVNLFARLAQHESEWSERKTCLTMCVICSPQKQWKGRLLSEQCRPHRNLDRMRFQSSRTLPASNVGKLSSGISKRRNRAPGADALPQSLGALPSCGDKMLQSAKKASTPPLCLASWMGSTAMVDVILQLGTNPDVTSPEGFTPLCLASLNGCADIAKLLIASEANINYTTPAGANPLRLAMRKGHADIVKVLIEAGADVDDVDRQGMPLISLSVMHDKPEILKLLLQSGARVDSNKQEASLSCSTPDFWVPPLCVAASKGQDDAVAVLLSFKADPNMNYGGFSPLYLASRAGHLKTVTLLADAGAEINTLSAQRRCPLSAAIEGKHKTVAMYLIEKGADCSALAGSSASGLLLLNQWQAEALVQTRQEKEKLIYGIGHMLTAAVTHYKS